MGIGSPRDMVLSAVNAPRDVLFRKEEWREICEETASCPRPIRTARIWPRYRRASRYLDHRQFRRADD